MHKNNEYQKQNEFNNINNTLAERSPLVIKPDADIIKKKNI